MAADIYDRLVVSDFCSKKDGHIKFYTKGEWSDICGRQGLVIADSFDSSIRFPRKKDTAYGYADTRKLYEICRAGSGLAPDQAA